MNAKPHMRMHEKVLLRVAAKAFIPLILLFALYVQFHGDFGPGGGFQAGVIFAAGFVLFGLVFGLPTLQQVVPASLVERCIALGLLIYGGVGVACMLQGGNFLDYGQLDHHNPVHGQHLGILIIELGVGITVAAAMLAIFYAFAGRERR